MQRKININKENKNPTTRILSIYKIRECKSNKVYKSKLKEYIISRILEIKKDINFKYSLVLDKIKISIISSCFWLLPLFYL